MQNAYRKAEDTLDTFMLMAIQPQLANWPFSAITQLFASLYKRHVKVSDNQREISNRTEGIKCYPSLGNYWGRCEDHPSNPDTCDETNDPLEVGE